jgi:hypothetical protein
LGRKSKKELKKILGVILSVIVIFIVFRYFRDSGPCKHIEASARAIKADSGMMVSKENPRGKNVGSGQEIGQNESADNAPEQEAEIADNDEFDQEEFDIADNNESDDDDRWIMRGRRINSF